MEIMQRLHALVTCFMKWDIFPGTGKHWGYVAIVYIWESREQTCVFKGKCDSAEWDISAPSRRKGLFPLGQRWNIYKKEFKASTLWWCFVTRNWMYESDKLVFTDALIWKPNLLLGPWPHRGHTSCWNAWSDFHCICLSRRQRAQKGAGSQGSPSQSRMLISQGGPALLCCSALNLPLWTRWTCTSYCLLTKQEQEQEQTGTWEQDLVETVQWSQSQNWKPELSVWIDWQYKPRATPPIHPCPTFSWDRWVKWISVQALKADTFVCVLSEPQFLDLWNKDKNITSLY